MVVSVVAVMPIEDVQSGHGDEASSHHDHEGNDGTLGQLRVAQRLLSVALRATSASL